MVDNIKIDPRKIPIIGEDIYQVGQVIKIVGQPCTPNATIAVKAFWTYAPTLLWTLYKPEALDLAFNRAGRRHSRKRYKRVRLSDLNQIEVPKNNRLAWAVFHTANLTQKLGWYFLVADATTDFAINWTTMAYSWSGCVTPDVPYAYFKGESLGYVEPVVGYMQANGQETGGDNGGAASPSQVTIAKTGPVRVTYSANFDIIPYHGTVGVVTKVEIYIKSDERPAVKTEADLSGGEDDGPTSVSGVVERYINFGSNVRAWALVYWNGGSLKLRNQLLQITGVRDEGILPDP